MATKKTKNKQWFIKVRGSYLPNNTAGRLSYIPYLAYMIGVLVLVVKADYQFWQGVFVLIPNLVVATIIMTYIASRKS